MTAMWCSRPVLAWCASTRRGVLRESRHAAPHKIVAALAMGGAKWQRRYTSAATLQIELAAGRASHLKSEPLSGASI